ncbi:hypothetical protein [Sphingomonas sp. KR3-1]|uniref:hypothetical protein n=1 Tax=Sphingomonas sp. KR3-1 TaxID=3156611 RepID=UPI0032B3F32C
MAAYLRSAIAMALSVQLSACLGDSDMCANDVIARRDAPGGGLSAVMFERSCGATTGFSTQISILRRGEVPVGKGNIFIADDDHGAAAPGDWGGPWAEMQWLGPDRLRIRYAPKARTFLRREAMSGVKIVYR